MNAQVVDNSQLVTMSLGGDREAFRQIVERYQNLVCALAFSACGNVAKSEDLTQETFLVAWQQLRELREPENLKAWLCGIVRNLARNAERKRSPSQLGAMGDGEESIEAVDGAMSPHDIAAAREEAAIVEQALSVVPEMYREPLVLFYREDQSVQSVAEALGLSPDAVRQRLSRGREMLRDQVEAVIERSLRRTKPTSALTIAIMAALPGFAAQAQAAVLAGAAAKAAPAAAKTLFGWSLLAAALSPLISLVTLVYFGRMAERAGKSPREKQFLVRFTWQIGVLVMACAVATSVLGLSHEFMMTHPVWFGVLLAASIFVPLALIAILSVRADRRLKQIRLEEGR
jgi:RNA polymerase sigma factor (sigma-70 family)